MWELDYKESWVWQNWCFWTVVLEKTLESPLDCKEIQPVDPKGDQSWVFIGRTDVEAETPIFWPPDAKRWLIGKDSDAGKDLGQEEKGITEDEIVIWHHRLDGHGFGLTLGDGDGQGGLECCSSWVRKELDMTEWLNWTELNLPIPVHFSFSPFRGIFECSFILLRKGVRWDAVGVIFSNNDHSNESHPTSNMYVLQCDCHSGFVLFCFV